MIEAMSRSISYARSGDVNIAYQVTGDGPIDLVLVPGFFSHLELDWEHPDIARLLRPARLFRPPHSLRQARDRPFRPDRRPAGPRDPHGRRPGRDGCRRQYRSCPLRLLGGRTDVRALRRHLPGAHARLVIYGSYAKRIRTDDYPWAPTWEERVATANALEANWGEDVDMATMCDGRRTMRCRVVQADGARVAFPCRGARPDPHELAGRHPRHPSGHPLPDARPPPHRRPRFPGRRGPLHGGADSGRAVHRALRRRPRSLGRLRSDARPGRGVPHRRSSGGAGRPRPGHRGLHRHRRVDASACSHLGDAAWARLLERHHDVVRSELPRFGGTEVDTAGDGFLARSTARRAPFAAASPSATRCATSTSRSASASTPARSSARGQAHEGLPFTSRRASCRWPSPARSW